MKQIIEQDKENDESTDLDGKVLNSIHDTVSEPIQTKCKFGPDCICILDEEKEQENETSSGTTNAESLSKLTVLYYHTNCFKQGSAHKDELPILRQNF